MTASHRLTVDRHMAVRFHIFVEFFEYDRMYQQNKKNNIYFCVYFCLFLQYHFRPLSLVNGSFTADPHRDSAPEPRLTGGLSDPPFVSLLSRIKDLPQKARVIVEEYTLRGLPESTRVAR